jgi:hypothetical protein
MRIDRWWVIALVVVATAGAVGCYLLRGSSVPHQAASRPLPPRTRDEPATGVPTPAARDEPAPAAPPSAQPSAVAAVADRGATPDASAPTPGISPQIVEIRAVVLSDPARAEQLIYADREAFPGSPFADERDALLVSAIHNQHRPQEARAAARSYLRDHPNGRFVDFVTRATGVHPD